MNKELIIKNKQYLLAFSGGPDSVYSLLSLIDLFKNEFNYSDDQIRDHLFLCYIDYHDSDEIDDEEEVVFEYVNKYNLKVFKYDNFDIVKDKTVNFEAAAREFRYDLFSKIVSEYNLEGCITGHHKTDHVETYLMQLKRKNLVNHYGLNEVSIIKNIKIIRPFLDISKDKIKEYLDKNGYRYYEDKTNYSDHERNNIRKTLTEDLIDEYSKECDEMNIRLNKDMKFINDSFIVDKNEDPESPSLSVTFKVRPLNYEVEMSEEEYLKRLIFESLVRFKNRIPESNKYYHEELFDPEKLSSITYDIYYHILGKKNGVFYCSGHLALISNKGVYQLNSPRDYRSTFSYEIDPGIQKLENENIAFDLTKVNKTLFDFLNIEVEPDASYRITTISTLFKDDLISKSRLCGRTYRDIFYELGIPRFLIKILPIIVNQNDEVIYLFRVDKPHLYKDLIRFPRLSKLYKLIFNLDK